MHAPQLLSAAATVCELLECTTLTSLCLRHGEQRVCDHASYQIAGCRLIKHLALPGAVEGDDARHAYRAPTYPPTTSQQVLEPRRGCISSSTLECWVAQSPQLTNAHVQFHSVNPQTQAGEA